MDAESLAISQWKLEALRKRRASLGLRYAELAEKVAAGPTDMARLSALQAGLAAMKSGSEALHPDAALIADALRMDGGGRLTASLVSTWLPLLQKELVHGQARAEYTFLFGSLLDEWVRATTADAPPALEPSAIEPWRRTWSAPPSDDARWVDRIVDSLADRWPAVVAHVEKAMREDIEEAVSVSEVTSTLEELQQSPFRSAALRRQATRLLESTPLQAEYASALSLRLEDLEQWAWPAEGVPLRSFWDGARYRAYLDQDLMTALFLEILGDRWSMTTQHALSMTLFDDEKGLFNANPKQEAFASWLAGLARYSWGQALRSGGTSHYVRADEVFDGPSSIEELAAYIAAALRGLRLEQPGRPFVVVRADLEAFGPSFRHAAGIRLLERLGVPARWIRFFRTWLAAPVRIDGAVRTSSAGIFPDQRGPLALANAVAALADFHAWKATWKGPERGAGQVVLRSLDDVVFMGTEVDDLRAGWTAWQEAITGLGWRLGAERTGSVVVGGEGAAPAGFPSGPVRLGLLQLGSDGRFSIDQADLAKAAIAVRERLREDQPILESVSVLSSGVREVARRLFPFSTLGEERPSAHLERVVAALGAWEAHLFGEGRSGRAELGRRLQQRFPFSEALDLPEAIWYWPLTAGGFGLFDPASQLAGIASYLETVREPRTHPPFSALRGPDRQHWLLQMLRQDPDVRPRRPVLTPHLEGLLEDFARRGAELRGEKWDDEEDGGRARHDLTFYWQWVIALHGPGLLARFGTFRFLESSLVPMGLIVELKRNT
jgi:hypothetical protein